MSFVYGCPRCRVSLEMSSPRRLNCARCGAEMVQLATARWLFRCSSCGETLDGGPSAEPRVQPCPFCDGGMMHPSRPL